MRPNLITRLKEEWNNLDPVDPLRGLIADAIDALVEAQPSKPWVRLVHEETHEAIGTAGVDLLELAKLWSDNKVHVYQFDNEARKIIKAVLCRASAKLREKNERGLT